jgi:hypothetical protein
MYSRPTTNLSLWKWAVIHGKREACGKYTILRIASKLSVERSLQHNANLRHFLKNNKVKNVHLWCQRFSRFPVLRLGLIAWWIWRRAYRQLSNILQGIFIIIFIIIIIIIIIIIVVVILIIIILLVEYESLNFNVLLKWAGPKWFWAYVKLTNHNIPLTGGGYLASWGTTSVSRKTRFMHLFTYYVCKHK